MSGRPTDAGETLVEILLSIMILGIAVAALMFGMGAAATTSGYHDRQAQQAETVRNYVAALQAMTYVDCATQYAPSTAGFVPAGDSVTAAQVVGYASGAQYPYPAAAPATCTPSPPRDEGAQQLRFTISQGDARVRSDEIYVIKRKPCTVVPC